MKPVYDARSRRPELADGKWREHLLLDDCDRGILETHRLELKWGQGRYVKVLATPRGQKNGTRKSTALARLIMDAPDGLVVDHINRNTLDNRRCNLRVCSQYENMFNVLPRGPSGFRGITKVKSGKWHAKIRIRDRFVHLGRFDCPVEAARAWDAAAIAARGAAAALNFPTLGDAHVRIP